MKNRGNSTKEDDKKCTNWKKSLGLLVISSLGAVPILLIIKELGKVNTYSNNTHLNATSTILSDPANKTNKSYDESHRYTKLI